MIFFFLTSAYLIYRIYAEKSIQSPIAFLRKNVSKFYVLYITTHIVVAVYLILNGASIPKTLIKLFLAATLMQSMTVTGATILNGACWFLSTLTFLYFLSPFLIRFVKSLNQKQVYTVSVVMLVTNFILHLIVSILSGTIITEWVAINLTYTFPIYWIPFYTLGMLANRWKFFDGYSMSRTLTEVLCVTLAFVTYLFGLNGTIWGVGFCNLTYVIVLLPIVVLFSKEEGWISKHLAKSRLSRWTVLTMEMYMIHYVVITCLDNLFKNMSETLVGGILSVAIVFVVTITISIGWKKLYEMMQYRLKAHDKPYI